MRYGYWLGVAAMLLTALASAADACPEWAHQRASQEIQRLGQQLAQWDKAYHDEGKSPVPDDAYDQMRTMLAGWLAALFSNAGGGVQGAFAQSGKKASPGGADRP
ncbi:hypothetical protein [Lonsdalea quercina]|uniref:hypothetical protein n=1 Tax=Lonsdalea quercina TaxID=71657 RepID=UPI00397578B8